MKHKGRLVRWLGGLSTLGGTAALPLILAFNQISWGAPGTSAYQIYELLNRLMAVLLLLMSAGWLGLFLRWPPGYGRWAALLAFIGSLIMAAGTAAEFWLFTIQPYGETASLRNAAWGAFGVGGWMLILGATVLGVAAWRSRTWPRWCAILLMLAVPIDLVAYFIFDSPFTGTTVLTLVIAWQLIMDGKVTGEAGTAAS